MKEYWESEGIARHKMKVSAQLYAPDALPPGKEPRLPIV